MVGSEKPRINSRLQIAALEHLGSCEQATSQKPAIVRQNRESPISFFSRGSSDMKQKTDEVRFIVQYVKKANAGENQGRASAEERPYEFFPD